SNLLWAQRPRGVRVLEGKILRILSQNRESWIRLRRTGSVAAFISHHRLLRFYLARGFFTRRSRNRGLSARRVARQCGSNKHSRGGARGSEALGDWILD